MNVSKVFKKQGGMKLLRQYIRNHTFFLALSELALLGTQRTSLEILRLAVQCKTKNRLEKRYKRHIARFNDSKIFLESNSSNKVWVCWFQGMENAPELVKCCYNSLVKHLTDREIILITSENMFDYVEFPDYIIDKWKSGIITHTHMTDLLRLELLIKYGGMWIDATVFCSADRDEIPDFFFDSDLFMYQCLKPGRDGHTHMASSWLMSAKSNNRILLGTRDMLYIYWKKNNSMKDYFLLHIFISLMLESNKDEWMKIVPRDNATPHILLLRLFEQYDENVWDDIKKQTPFHKLSYKFNCEDALKEDTFYKKVLEL